MGAGHSHDHGHAVNYGPAFAIGVSLNLTFVVVEAGFGFYADSTALLADAGHNFSDVLGLILAWVGAALVKRSASDRFSYGLKKSSIIAALLNALLLLVAVGAIVLEAIRRLQYPETPNGPVVMIVATVGILINGITAWMFVRGRKGDINIRGAYLHMAADAAVSAGVVIAGLLIVLTGYQWIDPIASLAIAVIILWGTWSLLTESVSMTLAGVPKGIDPRQIEQALGKLAGVANVHHLHVWPISTTETALTVHIEAKAGIDRDVLLGEAQVYLHKTFGISHSTIQMEAADSGHPDDCTGPSHDHHDH